MRPKVPLAFVGGTAATTVRMLSGRRTASRIDAAARRPSRAVSTLSVNQRKKLHGLSAQRADIIQPAAHFGAIAMSARAHSSWWRRRTAALAIYRAC